MYCPKCGWKNAEEATKCASCGADLPGASPAQPQQTQYLQQPGYQPGQAEPGNTHSIIGLILGIASLILCPLLFGAAGITLGAIGMSKKERLGLTTIIVSACCMVVGLVIRAVIIALKLRAMHRIFGMH